MVNAATRLPRPAKVPDQAPVVDLPVQTGCSDRSRRLLYLYGWIFAGLSGRVVDTKADVAARTDAPTARTAIGGFSTLRNKLCATTRPNERSQQLTTTSSPPKTTVQHWQAQRRFNGEANTDDKAKNISGGALQSRHF